MANNQPATSNEQPVKPRPMNKTELAVLYNVCPRTLNKWILHFKEEIGHINGTNILTSAQVKIIFEKIGEP